MSWSQWFVQLSGWPVFLAIVALVFLFMLALSVALTWLGNRSVVQSMAIVASALTVLALGALVALGWITRAFSR